MRDSVLVHILSPEEWKEHQAHLRAYYMANRDKIRGRQNEYFKKYYEENKDKFKDKHKETYQPIRINGKNLKSRRRNTYKQDNNLTVKFD